MLDRKTKQDIIDRLKEDITKARAVFLTNVIGISANDAVSLRSRLRKAQGKIVVTKNTLLKIAGKGTNAEPLLSNLQESNAIAFAFGEAPEVAKCLKKAEDDSEVVAIKGGLFDDRELTSKQIRVLAELPSREEMLGTVLATMMSPVSAFVRVLSAMQNKKENNI